MADVRPHSSPRLRASWYAAAPGRWRDWVTVLHLPYTAWHLSYVLIGAALAPQLHLGRLGATVLAFALAVGVGAHGLDELRGRPLGTVIPNATLLGVSLVALAGAAAVGVVGVNRVGWGLVGFIAVGVVLVVGYNLELWGGRLHTDAVFALAWGAFPLLTSYYAQTGTVGPAALVAAAFAYWLSGTQRVLSTEARTLRRRVQRVTGELVGADGTRRRLTRQGLLAPVERSLATLSWATCALGIALVLAKVGH